MKTYLFHEDAGHGWLAVKRQELIDLGIIAKVSRCSYENGDTVYLEEDCDLSIFMRACQAKYGVMPTFKNHYLDRSPVRSYAGFTLRDGEA